MKPFHTLTHQGQVRRLRQVAQDSLQAYEVSVHSLRLIQHGENTTFRVATIPTDPGEGGLSYATDQYLLRIHRPAYQDADSIRSELAWLADLRRRGLLVPEPVPTAENGYTSVGRAPGVPGERICTLLRWLKGRFVRNPGRQHLTRLGILMAQLHNHASGWTPPATFQRRSWDIEGLFGDNAGFERQATVVWSRVPARHVSLMQQVVARLEQITGTLGQSPAVWGLVHADLHLGNVLFARGTARAIDFDDCGYAYWLYDLAVVLADYLYRSDWSALRSALLDGYAQVRPVPDHIELLPAFMAARLVSLLLWSTDMAETYPHFAATLDSYYEREMSYIDKLHQMLP